MIKQFVSGIIFLSLACGSIQELKAQPAMDTIIKIEGKILIVNVTEVTAQFVSFLVPGNDQVFTMERKEIQRIIYKNGGVEDFNKPAFTMIDENAWEAVWITEDQKEVSELYRRGTASANSAASSRSPKAAKTSATIKLQKKAAAMKGSVVLVTRKQATGGYGEFPGYYIEGVVYGNEPLEEGETETTDKDSLDNGK